MDLSFDGDEPAVSGATGIVSSTSSGKLNEITFASVVIESYSSTVSTLYQMPAIIKIIENIFNKVSFFQSSESE